METRAGSGDVQESDQADTVTPDVVGWRAECEKDKKVEKCGVSCKGGGGRADGVSKSMSEEQCVR